MNIEMASIEALRIAREIVPAKGDYRKQLEATFKMASALTESFSVGSFDSAINCLSDLFQKGKNVISVPHDRLSDSGVETLSLHPGDCAGGAPNKSAPSELISAHSNSSSVQDGESVGELPTPSRTETVAAPSYTKEATRTHGGAA